MNYLNKTTQRVKILSSDSLQELEHIINEFYEEKMYERIYNMKIAPNSQSPLWFAYITYQTVKEEWKQN